MMCPVLIDFLEPEPRHLLADLTEALTNANFRLLYGDVNNVCFDDPQGGLLLEGENLTTSLHSSPIFPWWVMAFYSLTAFYRPMRCLYVDTAAPGEGGIGLPRFGAEMGVGDGGR
ncbi:hypothetical protein VE00_04386 [Pseudogymnoascus sp. WSF 3629]|nr:hypothetical protein VE00_04386 [Pseudogymnoascus sp. WSF 3629]